MIAAVAATFGVPVIALLSSPGETGGSYGSAQTLDEPTLKTMTEIQSSWADFYKPILEGLGAKDAFIEFPAIQTDPAYRRINSIVLAHKQGLVHDDEGRDAVLSIEDIPRLHPSAPKREPATQSSGINPGDNLSGREQGVTDHSADDE